MKSYWMVLMLALVVSARADTLTLRNGTRVAGSWLGGDAGQITFLVDNQVRKFRRSEVAEVAFGEEPVTPPPVQPPQPDARSETRNVPRPESVPNPPPPASHETLKAGQTIEQVEAALGKPATIFNAGNKKIYVYKDPPVKITFNDGKVVDLE
jgi:hypothetical protein